MPRTALHSDDIKIEQKDDLVGDLDLKERDGEVVVAQQLPKKAYLDELAFNEEPVTIRLEPSADKNAATTFPAWVNGKGAEVLRDGKWIEIAYLPVGIPLTIKRKYLEVIVRAKIDTIHTEVREPESERPNNIVQRFTSAVHSFSVIEDRNPRGAAWLTELRRRNL